MPLTAFNVGAVGVVYTVQGALSQQVSGDSENVNPTQGRGLLTSVLMLMTVRGELTENFAAKDVSHHSQIFIIGTTWHDHHHRAQRPVGLL